MQSSVPLTRDLLLIGGGHAHAVLLRMWGMKPLPGVRLTLVNPEPTAPYTGMLPGFVAGHYRREELDIDLVRLARFAGARLVLDRVIGLDPETGVARLEGRPDIAFDIASVDIGITSGMPAEAEGSISPAKPLGPFADAWTAFVAAVQAGETSPTAAVIGGGLGGCELAMAMAWRLGAVAGPAPIKVSLYEAAPEILPGGPRSLRKTLGDRLARAGVEVLTASRVGDGGLKDVAFVAATAGATPSGWLQDTGLALKDGFIRVNPELRSISHPGIFAVGDAAHMDASPRPKAGVFAVRQGPALYDNLRAALSGGPLRPFHPQKDYLKLVSLGRQAAVAEKWGLSLTTPGLWRWKDRIDRTFMNRLNALPVMPPPRPTPGPTALGVSAMETATPLCGGCGSKVGPATLSAALAALQPPRRPDSLRGQGDDAAVLSWGEAGQQVISTDHFRAFTLDPYGLARVIANHALGDIWAMGADPQAAVASLILPPMSSDLQGRTVVEILAGLQAVLTQAGADLVGGHTSLGAELTVGLTVTGLMGAQSPIGLAGARPGDCLMLTKPVGVGVVLAAEMRGLADGRDVAKAFDQMQTSGGPAATILRETATAMTDVTGFGLAGHLDAMLRQSGMAGRLSLGAVPWAQGAVDLACSGVRSSIFPETSAMASEMAASAAVRADARFDLLFDPQTAGGLLAAIPSSQVDQVIARCAAMGQPVWTIGEITGPAADGPRLSITA
jgi:selenide, water dikinase